MLLDNYKKESPIVGVAGIGGGINSYIFLSSGGGGDYVISKSLRFNSADSIQLILPDYLVLFLQVIVKFLRFHYGLKSLKSVLHTKIYLTAT